MRRRPLIALLTTLAALATASVAGAITINGTVTAGATLTATSTNTPSFNLTLNGVDQTPTYTLRHQRRRCARHRLGLAGRLEPDGHLDDLQRRRRPHVPDDRVDDHRRRHGVRRELDVHATDERDREHEPFRSRSRRRSGAGQVRERIERHRARHEHDHGNRAGRRAVERLRRNVFEHGHRRHRGDPVG